jgi:hypothetical protein
MEKVYKKVDALKVKELFKLVFTGADQRTIREKKAILIEDLGYKSVWQDPFYKVRRTPKEFDELIRKYS